MKRIIITLLLLTAINIQAQSKKKKIKVKATSFFYTVDSIQELKDIEWKNAKEFFSVNDEDEEIVIGIRINEGKDSIQFKTKEKFKLRGKTKNLGKLIKMMSSYQSQAEAKANTSSLVYTVDSIEELKSINWKEAKDFFEGNDGDSEITLGCKVKRKKRKKSKLEIKESFEVTGKMKDLDKLIKIMSNYTSSQKE